MDTRSANIHMIVFFNILFLHVALSTDTVTLSILEELPTGSIIGNVKTEAQLDREYTSSVVDQLTFTILPPDNDDVISGEYFEVEETTGMLKVSSVIDRDDERLCAYKSTCQVTFEIAVGPATYFTVITVRVNILDQNDNSPHFSKTEFNLDILESAIPGTTFNLPSVFDLDSSEFGIKRFEIRPNNGQFNITWSRDLHGRVQPKLELTRFLDREEIHTFDLSVVAYDSGSPPNSAAILVHVTVEDTNDNSPEFSLPTYETRIDENTVVGTSLLSIYAHDTDIGDSGTVRYALTAQNIGDEVTKFRIDPESGVIYLEERVDREQHEVFYLMVVASDQGKDARQASTSVTIYVDDVNDNAPVIHISVITTSGRAEVLETAEVGTFVALVSVIDRDWGQNAEATCSLSSRKFLLQNMEPKNKFKIITDAKLDREQRDSYELLVSCEDQGSPAKSSQETVAIYVTDVNDNAPIFTQETYSARINENNEIGASVTRIECTDEDIGDNAQITYSLLGNNNGQFVIDENTGIITANTRLDYESMQQARLHVQASDAGEPPLTATSLVVVQIGDVNDQPPEFIDESFTFIVRENQMDHVNIGSVLASDGDSDSYSRFWYSLTPETPGTSDHFRVSRENGSLTLLKPLDREQQAFYHMIVTAINFEPPSLSATVSVTVLVDDVNDNAPIVDFPSIINNTVHISSRLPPGYKVTQIRAHDLDSGENAELSYFLAQSINEEQMFGVDPKSGELFLNHDMSHAKTASYHLKILVKDNGVPERTSAANVKVVVNQSLAVPLSGSSPLAPDQSQQSDRNMTIIIIVVATSGVIIIVLLGSIVFVLLTSRRHKRSPHTSLMTTSVVMDNLDADSNRTHENRLDPEGNSVTMATNKKQPDAKLPLHEEFQRYAPLGNKAFYNLEPDVDRKSPAHPVYPAPAPPRGVYVNYNAKNPHVDLSFMSEESDQTRQELRALTKSPCPTGPADLDRESASSVEDSVTDSGRGGSEEGDPTSGDEHGHMRSRRQLPPRGIAPATGRQKKEILLAPDYGLSQLQTQFDPHYQIKYNNLDYNQGAQFNNNSHGYRTRCPDEQNARSSHEADTPSGYNKQTVRNVKAKDRHKKADTVSASVLGRYKQEAEVSGPGDNPATGTFSDANSLMNYKMMGSGCLSEITDATSETSATSGSYIIEHDDDARGVTVPLSMLAASHC